ncbi:MULTISPECIES: hypothetical protein [unclassified Methylobacterium]|uniref:hypothetical protein n=1 Tax=unclassified Methylobacterium TaxID=2615210 RepID=UPI0006FBC5CC|nr:MULTISPECIES: hypothetical protein [unclassified Methylobacterium]KQP61421.1 hypothetical protein ASF39_01670 [Methylobacterium sp. Leaf108]KQT80625.1 hypothetical protein ASG59_04105 [Methylobacterium sp. Leaf466]
MTNKKAGRKASVVLAPGLSLRRRRGRKTGMETLGAQALAAPVPGPLLVLLSRLHRREDVSHDEAEAAGGLPPRNRDL